MGEKWCGGVKTTIKAPIDRAWAIGGNFCALDKWISTVDECRLVEGKRNQIGCVRYMVGNSFPRPDGCKSWAKEKLLAYDADSYSLTYAMIDGNFGLQGYVNHFQLKDVGDGLILVDWTYEVDPVECTTEEERARYMKPVFNKSIAVLEKLANADVKTT